MHVRRPRLAGLIFSLALLAVLAFVLPASASAARILYASGHGLDETRLMTFGGHTAVDPGVGGFDGCSDEEWAAALARTDFDVLMVGENAPSCLGPDPSDLSSETLQAIGNYVRNGKPIIITGAHDDENDFMNFVFGFSTTNEANDSGENLTGTLQPGATGTPFAGGPATLTTPSETNLLGSTPGTTIYSGPEGVYVFTTPFGAGVVTYLAWDFCCGSDPVMDDWYRVLDRALAVKPAVAPAPADVCMGQKATVIGTSGNDSLTGTPGPDVIVGLGGADKVNGLGGNDVMCGRTGKDKLKGGGGNDRIQGNKSADRLVGGAGGDQCRGGKGKDKASTCETTRALSAV
jgi:RTX calcium-binding nonapeptide repeat (4 copies)